jgi:hypothetical protein
MVKLARFQGSSGLCERCSGNIGGRGWCGRRETVVVAARWLRAVFFVWSPPHSRKKHWVFEAKPSSQTPTCNRKAWVDDKKHKREQLTRTVNRLQYVSTISNNSGPVLGVETILFYESRNRNFLVCYTRTNDGLSSSIMCEGHPPYMRKCHDDLYNFIFIRSWIFSVDHRDE